MAAIVAVDIAGYSSRAEADESAAVLAVAALARLIELTAADHGGRVFNTAGDGFMLEFHTASGALAAAKDIAAEADTPVRIGVHLGEVYATATGDLLGHGVNVAARLQAMAKPGCIMVSDDVRRAVRGALAQGLVSQGRHRLDKMKETAEVFSLSAAPPARQPLAWPAWAAGKAGLRIVGAVGLALAVLAAAAFGTSTFKPASQTPPNLITAVRDFTVRGAGLDPQYGRDLADNTASALGERQAPTVSRDLVRTGNLGGARLLVGGEVEQIGSSLRAHMHIDDGQAGLILWAADVERPADHADGLRDETATKIADLIDRLRTQAGPEGPKLKPDAMAALLKGLEIDREGPGRWDRSRQAWKRVLALAPNFSRGHAALAYNDVAESGSASPALKQMRLDEARREIKTALSLDPHNGSAYVVHAMMEPEGAWAAQEAWVLRGLAADPDYSPLNAMEGDIVASAGRFEEAVAFQSHALMSDPLSANKTLGVVFALIQTGRLPEANAMADRMSRLWPDYVSLPVARRTLDWIYGDPVKARAALEAEVANGSPMTAVAVAAWRQVLDAKAGKATPAAAARTLVAAAQADPQIDLGLEETSLAQLGQLDLAFEEINRRLFGQHARFYVSTLFQQGNANLWNDPRFLTLLQRLGVVDYWKASGHGPDACRLPTPPAFCRVAPAPKPA